MVAVPEYISNNAQRALDNIEFKGSGVTPKTLREARSLARGEASENKIMRMGAWFARHETDLRTPAANDYLSNGGAMTAGQWAWLAWGGDLTRDDRLRAKRWADSYTEKVRKVSSNSKKDNVNPLILAKGHYGDDMPDPLMHLLKAYRSLSQMGSSFREINAEVLAYIGVIESALNEAATVDIEPDLMASANDIEKDYDEDSNPLSCLLMAYNDLVRMPAVFNTLRPALMGIIHMLEHELGVLPEHEEDMMEEDQGVLEEEQKYGYKKPKRRYIDKEIVQEISGGSMKYCVKSPRSGRSFGCYEGRKEAEVRLEQIERFSETMKDIGTDQLVKWHDAVHTLAVIKDDHVIVHNLLEDLLEERQVAPGTDGDPESKLAMLDSMDGRLPIAKADDRRYTLGPAYVPEMQDAHGEFTDADTLQEALWNWVRKGNRNIYLQHSDKVAGEMVEVLTWPFPIETEMTVPGEQVTKYSFPENTPFLGVIWEPWAWQMVKAGELRGYSIGGKARRIEAELPEQALV